MLGWHFCKKDSKLGYGDGRQIRTGRTLKVKPPLILCERGLHASKRIIDALHYARSPVVCRVILSGEIEHGTDKSIATERTVIRKSDATNLLHEFACLCAERALKKAKVKDKRCWQAIETKRLWIKGKATNDELSAAAVSAAEAATWSAVEAAAWRDTEPAMSSAERATARAAVRATKAAAEATIKDAVWAAKYVAKSAAEAAAVTATRTSEKTSVDILDAEERWQNKILTKMVKGLWE